MNKYNDALLERVADGVYKINEFDLDICYLVIGSTGALLIDCATGIADLKGLIDSITSLPLTVVCTHGHTDHIGGLLQFEEVYLHRDDFMLARLLKGLRKKSANRFKHVLERHSLSLKYMPKREFRTKLLPLNNGQVFELGGKTVSAHHMPGHSKGHVILKLHEDKLIFAGDNITDDLWMQLPFAVSLEEWTQSAKLLKGLVSGCDIWWGHRGGRVDKMQLEHSIELAGRIMESRRKNSLMKRKRVCNDPETGTKIRYRTDRIFK